MKQEVKTLNEQILSLSESFSSVHLEKGKIDEAFDQLRKAASTGEDGQFDHLDLATKRIHELQEEIRQMKKENESKSNDNGSSLSQFSSMETALKRSKEREAELQQEVVNAEKRVSNLEFQLKKTKEQLSTAELSVKHSESEVLTLKEELMVAMKKDAALADTNKQREGLQKEIVELKASISEYRQELSDKDGDIKRLRATIADKQNIMEGYVGEITRMKESRVRSESYSNKEQESLKLKFDEVCKERDSLQREVARLVAKRQTDVSIQIENQTDSYRKQLRDKDETIDRLRTESVTLQSENDKLKRERSLSTLSSPSRCDEKEYEALQRRYDRMWNEKESLKKEFEEFKMKNRSFSVDIESSRQEIREKEISIDRLRSENITLQAQIEALKKENAEVSIRSDYTMRVQSSAVQLDSNEDFYRQEIKDRDAVIDRLRGDAITLRAEIDGLKRDMRSYFSRTEYEALQMKHDEVLKDRDTLREELIVAKSSSERDVSIHIESRMETFQQNLREKDVLIDKLRAENLTIKNEFETLKRDITGKASVSDGYLAEIERLRQEILTMKTSVTDYESLKRTYDDVCKERDFVRNQLMEYKTQSEHEISAHIDSYSEAYRHDVREKELAIDRLRSENTTLRAELEGLRREMSTFYNRTEYESLKLQYDEMWKERDSLREQLIDVKSRSERDVLIQVENKTLIFQKEIREKEMEIGKIRSEGMSMQMTIDGFKRDLESKQYLIEGYQAEIERLKGEIANLKSTTVTITEYESVRRMYDDVLKERDAIRMELFEFKSNSERELSLQVDNQVKIYREEIREKEVIINNFRSESMKFQAENDRLKRELESKQYMVDGYLVEIDRYKEEIGILTKTLTEFESLKRSYEDVCRDRDYIQRQFTDFKSRSEQDTTFQIEIQTNGFRQEIKEKDQAIERFRSQNQILIEEVDGLKRERSTFYSKSEYESLRQQYEEMWKERDALRGQIAELKTKGERELVIQIESRTETYRTEIREKETVIARLQSETMKYQTEIDGLKRQLGNQEGYLVEIERLKKEVNTLRFPDIRGSAEYMSLQRSYEEVCKERDGLRAQIIDVKMKGEQTLENQVKIYHEEIREKEVAFTQLRSEDMALKAEIEGLKRQLGNQEAYLIEIDRLKEEVKTLRFPDIRGSAEYVSLQRSYEEVCKERDGLRAQIIDIKMKGEQTLENQVKIYREGIREKEVAFTQLRSEDMALKAEIEGLKRQMVSQETYLVEIERLKKEVNILRFPDIRGSAEYVSLQRSYEEVCKERDGLRGQIIDIKMKSEQNLENQMKIYREEIREKEVVFNQLRSEDISLKAEIEELKRQLVSQETYLVEIDRLKKEVNTLRFPDIRGSAEYVSLQRSYEEVCKERDGLQGQIVDIKMKGEQNLENQVRIYREEIREKEVAFTQLRSEDMALKAEIEGLKRQLGNQEAYLIEIDRLKEEVNTLRFPDIRGSAEYVSLQRSYEEVCKERDGLRGQIVDIKMKGEQNLENQVKIYREEIREKEVAFNQLRSEDISIRAEIEDLRRQLGNQEAYLVEIDRLKKEVTTLRFPDIRGSAEYVSLQRSYEEVCKERDGLRGQIVDIKMKGEQNLENQVKIYREEIREKEVVFNQLRSEDIALKAEIEELKRQLVSQETYLVEIDRLKKEVNTLRFPDIRGSAEYVSLQRSYEEVCKERDGLRGQIVNIKMKGEQNLENQVRIYREEIREKEVAFNQLRSDDMALKAEIESLKRDLETTKQRSQIEVERVRKESSVVSTSIIRSSAEFVTLQRSYDTICQERDALRQQLVEIRTKNEREVTIQIDNQVRVYRDEIKEKDLALERLRSETITLRSEMESLKRELASKGAYTEGYTIEIERLKREIVSSRGDYDSLKIKLDEANKEKDRLASMNFTLERDLRFAKETPVHDPKIDQELFNLKTKYAKLQEEYNSIMLAKSKLEEEMVIKVNSGMADKQEYIYKLEKENRELKSANEYYEKTTDEKNATIGDLRLKIAELQRTVEALRKDVYIADEAYEKAEDRLKEVLKNEYTPVTSYEIRRYRTTSTATKEESPKITNSTATSTYTVDKKISDADASHFSATSTPIAMRTKSMVDGERKGGDAPLDSDLAMAEGTFQSSTTTTKTVLNTDHDGESDTASVTSASGRRHFSTYYTQPSHKTSSSTTYRTITGYTTGPRSSVSGYRSTYSTGRKYSGRPSVTTRKFY